MTKKSFPILPFLSFGVITFLGSVLHFLYGWTGESVLVAPLAAVNESTWEHMKLYFFPALLFALVEGRFRRDRADYVLIKTKSILLGLTLIPVLFYTANGVWGKTPGWFNIAIFFLSALMATLYEIAAFNRPERAHGHRLWPIAILLLLALAFVLFTFDPPALPIFTDPIGGGRGI